MSPIAVVLFFPFQNSVLCSIYPVLIHHYIISLGVGTGNSIFTYRLSIHSQFRWNAPHPGISDLEQNGGPGWDFGVVRLREWEGRRIF